MDSNKGEIDVGKLELAASVLLTTWSRILFIVACAGLLLSMLICAIDTLSFWALGIAFMAFVDLYVFDRLMTFHFVKSFGSAIVSWGVRGVITFLAVGLLISNIVIISNPGHNAMVRVLDKKTQSHEPVGFFRLIDCEKQKLIAASWGRAAEFFNESLSLPNGKILRLGGIVKVFYRPDSAINILSKKTHEKECVLDDRTIARQDISYEVSRLVKEMEKSSAKICLNDLEKSFEQVLRGRLEKLGWSITSLSVEFSTFEITKP